MTKCQTMIALLLFLNCAISPTHSHASALAKLKLKVIDEEMKPVEGADIEVCLMGGCISKDVVFLKTDKNGHCTVSGLSKDGQISVGVTKKGYYSTLFHEDYYVTKLGIWQPWSKEYTVLFRPKINPVPMYVRNRTIEIPYIEKEIGFDLMKSDWVVPYGTGVTSDFIFKVNKRFNNVDDFDVTLTMTFDNRNDGIQSFKEDLGGDFHAGSRFRLLRTAPEYGYQQKLIKQMSEGFARSRNDYAEDNNFFFRVRSEVDEKGNLKRAMYGKIKGDIKLSPRTSKTLKIDMLYYLNPDYTRNMEFDPDKNLSGPLPKGELSIGLP